VPGPPFFLVANHLSYLDMVVLTHQTGCIYVARGDVEHWPVIGFLSKSMYVIFIDRKNQRDTVRVNRLISHAIEMGDAVAVFAESRISAGRDVEPFKSALIEPAVAAGLPVHYATLGYETLAGDPPAGEIVNWWRPEGFLFHLQRLLRHRGVVARVRFGDEPLCGDDRKELAPRLHAAVRANFTPLK
jgi:1-acyl-sn-glycerol-3-phosphate acyltransferase